MAKNEKQEWITTKIPKDIADEIEILLKNRKLGYNSKTGFIADALREKIDELSGKSKKHQTKLENKMTDIQKEFNVQLENVASRLEKEIVTVMLKKDIIEFLRLGNTCPTCKQKISEDHHHDLVDTKKKELEKFSLDEKLKRELTPEYQKELEQKRRKKIQSSKEIQKLVGPEYIAYDQDKNWIEREKENNKIKTLDGTKEKELDQTLNDILGGVDSSIIEEIKNQIKELNKIKK